MTEHSFILLCVDDEKLPLMLRKLVLEKHGYHVLTASSLAEAMQTLREQPVDLVLTDQLMPAGTGTELAQAIKAVWPELPVLLMSGVNEMPADSRYADMFISKTEGPASMCEKISAVLAAHAHTVD